MQKLIEVLASELERPRELTTQVADYIGGTYDVAEENLGEFLVSRLPQLEDDEHDLILSPLFTPKLNDQVLFANLLGTDSVPKAQWPDVIRELVQRPTRGHLVTSDGKTHEMDLREVTAERYVHRLRLEATIDNAILTLLEEEALAADRPIFKAIARRAIWENPARRDILLHFLTAAVRRGAYQAGDGMALLRLIEDYKPADIAHLLERIPLWQEALRQDIEAAANPKPFFSGTVQAHHGGDHDHRKRDEIGVAAKKDRFAFLGRLNQLLID